MDSSTERFKNNALLEFSKTVELFSLTPIEARLYTYLYVEGIPLTLDDMAEALGKSKTSMSTNIRSLLDLNLVRRVWKKGVRKDLYQANTQLFKLFMTFYMKKWTDALEDREDALLELKREAKQLPNDEKVEILEERLESFLDFHNKLEAFVQKASEIKKDG